MKWTSYLAVAGVAAALAAAPVSTAGAQDSTTASAHDSTMAHDHADSTHQAHTREGGMHRGEGRMHRGEAGMHRGEDRMQHGEGRMHRRMAGQRRMAGPAERLLARRAELGLTAEQVTRLEAIRDSFALKIQPHAAEARAAMDSVRANREAARQAARAVLTDEQRARFAEPMREKMKERREGMPRSPQGS